MDFGQVNLLHQIYHLVETQPCTNVYIMNTTCVVKNQRSILDVYLRDLYIRVNDIVHKATARSQCFYNANHVAVGHIHVEKSYLHFLNSYNKNVNIHP